MLIDLSHHFEELREGLSKCKYLLASPYINLERFPYYEKLYLKGRYI